ncbi:hypothetical protein [Embleya sp. NBC_00896]|nr:hypothetical protein OG928_32585 [Embleya sp. NBC_00896]
MFDSTFAFRIVVAVGSGSTWRMITMAESMWQRLEIDAMQPRLKDV